MSPFVASRIHSDLLHSYLPSEHFALGSFQLRVWSIDSCALFHPPHVQCHSSMRSRPDGSHRPNSTLLQGPMQQLVISKSTKLHICTDLGYQLHPNILVPQKLSYMTEPLVPTIVWAAGIEPGNALHVKL